MRKLTTFNRSSTYRKISLRSAVLYSPWSELQRLGDNKTIKYSWIWILLVPVVAKLLESVKSVKLDFLGPDFILNLTLPFSWQLFFGGSCFISIATYLYESKCPEIIRLYGKYSELETDFESKFACKDYILESYLASIFWKYSHNFEQFVAHVRLWVDHFPSAEPRQVPGTIVNLTEGEDIDVSDKLVATTESDEGFKVEWGDYVLKDEDVQDAFRFAYAESDSDFEKLRVAVKILYTVGLLFFFVVILQNVVYVINQVI